MTMPWPILARDALLVAVYNTVIAAFLTALTPFGLATNLIYAHCIGFSIYACVRGPAAVGRVSRGGTPGLMNGALGIPAGFALGFVLGTWANGLSLAAVLRDQPQGLVIAAAAALVFGILGTWHFHDQGRLAEARAEAQAERLRRVEQESLAARAELARLQAQIEPHFLFNTLSNVVGLVDSDPKAAQKMLLDLTALLRTSLARTRQPEVLLGEELELLRAYLGIMAVRMGPRLDWAIEAEPDLLSARLPPLLVQPLVENAIRHGLEPRTEGGRLTVRARREGDRLLVAVADSGRGLAGAGEGLGLANVRERLRACYGGAARLTLESNDDGGLTARLELPAHETPDR